MAEKKEKKESEILKEKLALKSESAWEKLEKGEHDRVFEFAGEYKEFLSNYKTEREIVEFGKRQAEKKGFIGMEQSNLKAGSNFWVQNKGKNIGFIVLGKHALENGMRLVISHVDACHLDLKINPLYENSGLVMLNTHYYGGIKKYHWVNEPLALHGVVFLKNGKKLEINLGEKSGEPVFCIPDLLPHVGYKVFAEKKIADAVTGEQLDAVAASIPFAEKDATEKIKLNLLKLLNEKYGMIEEDFFSAELQLVPSVKARDVGFDEGLIGAYGHDDRAGSFAALSAILDVKGIPEHTIMVLWMDKEEVGSTGATGSESFFLERVIEELAKKTKCSKSAMDVLAESYAISADVDASIDPKYLEFFDIQNSNVTGFGVSVSKSTGVGGKYDGSDANAEFMAFIRKLFNDNNVVWQTGELGKVDEGGGGTVAKYFAKYGCEIVDIGPPVLAMHSPFELVSKVDLYQAKKAYKVFLESK
ncbi:MAG: aminopeptidase [Candidatus Micrarchaeota archaeon]